MTTTPRCNTAWTVLVGVVLLGGAVFLLGKVLLPFVAGLAVAYFLDPLVDWLEKKGLGRGLAVALILILFLGVLVSLVALLAPLLQDQIVQLAHRVPEWAAAIQVKAAPFIERLQIQATENGLGDLKDAAKGYGGDVAAWAKDALGGLWAGGLALFSTLSLLFIMPLVAFYLLRDWDNILRYVDALVPSASRDTVRTQAREIDRTLSGFLRGQATVCLVMAVFYGVGLTIVGLDFGLLIGFGTGLLAFIPYVGMGLGLITAFSVAAFQFTDPSSFLLVGAVFAAGQVSEGFFLTPRLVGGSAGLHPVWVLFALMAGGSLLGFTGVLLAIPTAAVAGVLIRFWVGRYKAGPSF